MELNNDPLVAVGNPFLTNAAAGTLFYSGGLQVADAPLARQSSAASGKPDRLGGTAPGARTTKPEWLRIFQDFPGRIVLGINQHYPKPKNGPQR